MPLEVLVPLELFVAVPLPEVPMFVLLLELGAPMAFVSVLRELIPGLRLPLLG